MKLRPLALLVAVTFACCPIAFPLDAAPFSLPPLRDVAPAPPHIPDRVFNLMDFGAVADGHTSNTQAFTAAIAAVSRAGGGTLTVPSGVYFTGPIVLCDAINLHLDAGALILFSTKSEGAATNGRHSFTLLSVPGRHDVMISGTGTINGNGAFWWPGAIARRDPVTGKQFPGGTTVRPPILVFSHSTRLRVEGITLTNAPDLNLGINDCQDAAVEGITIYNPATSPNTDGIDPKTSSRVLISRCRIDTGDDCIAAGGSADSSGETEKDVLITDCTFLHGHGCSIGSGTSCGVSNFVVRRCTFDGTTSGIRLKAARDRGGLVENLLFTDLEMKNVGQPLSIDGHYQGTTVEVASDGDPNPAEPITSTTPQWRNIVVRNLSAMASTTEAGLIVGLPEMPAENILLEHVRIEAPEGLHLSYARGITLRDVQIKAAHGPSLIVANTVKDLKQE